MTESTKLCKDCKWYRKNWFSIQFPHGEEDECANPQLQRVSIVNGHTKNVNCSANRHYGGCMSARLWEPR